MTSEILSIVDDPTLNPLYSSDIKPRFYISIFNLLRSMVWYSFSTAFPIAMSLILPTSGVGLVPSLLSPIILTVLRYYGI